MCVCVYYYKKKKKRKFLYIIMFDVLLQIHSICVSEYCVDEYLHTVRGYKDLYKFALCMYVP